MKEGILYLFLQNWTLLNTFFPSVTSNWNWLNPDVLSFSNDSSLKSSEFLESTAFILVGIKWLTRLKLSSTRLRKHKFTHDLQETLNLFCSFNADVETTTQFLHCHFYNPNLAILIYNSEDNDNGWEQSYRPTITWRP